MLSDRVGSRQCSNTTNIVPKPIVDLKTKCILMKEKETFFKKLSLTDLGSSFLPKEMSHVCLVLAHSLQIISEVCCWVSSIIQVSLL